MLNKKKEHDELKLLSEKDLWCRDLDDFVREWNNQLKEEEEYQKNIRNTNRRVSRKIGAGKKNANGRAKPLKIDEDFNPKPRKNNIVKSGQVKTQQKFIDNFTKPKKESESLSPRIPLSVISDDEFDAKALIVPKNESQKISQGNNMSSNTLNSRSKRTAVPKTYDFDSDESDGSALEHLNDIGDVGNLVKGINSENKADSHTKNGRLSLFTSRSSVGHGSASILPKLKSKPSRGFDEIDGEDDTNYEMLARSSPQKANGFESNRSPKKVFSDDEDELDKDQSTPPQKLGHMKKNEIDDEDESIFVRKGNGRSRPARAAANSKSKKSIYVDSDIEDTFEDDPEESSQSENESFESD